MKRRVAVNSNQNVEMETYKSLMKTNKYFLCSLGLWPYQSKFSRKLISLFVWFTIVSFLIPEMIALVNNWGDMDILIPWLPPYFVMLVTIICFTAASVKRNKIELIFSKMKEDWLLCDSQLEFEILRGNGLVARNINNARIVFYYTAIVEFFTIPMIPNFLDAMKPLNESRTKKLIFFADYLVDSNDINYYAAITIHQLHVSILVITVILTVDGIFIVFVYHACGQLEILGLKMMNIVKIDYNVDISNEKTVQKEIKFCVEKHKSVIKFVSQINDCFSVAYFLALGLNMVMISFTLLQLVMNLNDIGEATTTLSYSLGQVLRLFYLTIPSQRLIDQSAQLSQNLYYSYWYNLSPESKKLLKIIMIRCIKPCTFTAGKLYSFSMSNFGAVVKTSISFFTVLLSVRK